MGSIFPPCDSRLLDAIRTASGAIIISHRNPDGDAIASSLAAKAILSRLGKRCELLSDGPFLRSDIRQYEPLFSHEASAELIAADPLVIVLDCSTPDRPGEAFRSIGKLRRIVIDHHSSGVPFTEEGMSYIVPESPSTTLCLNQVRIALGVPLDEEIASFLYMGFATDTGFYHFLSERTAPDSLRAAAEFCEAGVSPYDVYDSLHDGRRLEDIKDMAKVILSARPVLGGRLLIAHQGIDMKDGKLSDGVYASLLETEGIKAVVLIKDKGETQEIGFRSKHRSGLDVGTIASLLGGGGHIHAAGATISGTPEDAERTVIDLIAGKLD